jgi:ATP-binding cassette subfamily G (WHITE) protein 2 (SNQ2)
VDVHFPHLTVQQTLDFAISLRTPETRFDNQTRQEYKNFTLQLLTTVFGLRHTLGTKVGNDYVRGVSGGERKRVSIAEALASQASIYCWDNATRGLDASTALEYTHAIRASANFLRNVGIVAIYQASENIYDLFDKVTVLYAGRQIYFGTTKNAKAYFVEMGFNCPPRQATAEFLTAITDPKGRSPKPGFENKVPRTPEEFEAYWHNSAEFHSLVNEIDEYNAAQSPESTIERFVALSNFHKMKGQREKSRFTVSYMTQLKHVALRGYQRLMGDKAYTITNVIGTIAQALIIGSLYYDINTNTSGAFSRAGVIFFTLMFNSLSAMAEIPNYFTDRPIVMKQKGYSLYHPSTESIQYTLSNFPFKIVTYIIYGVIVYFLSQLQQQAGKFFFFLLILVFVAFSIAIFFQMLTSWTQQPESALALAGVALIIIFVYSGYIVTLRNMRPWFKWLSYLNPLQFGFESLITNEFHGVEIPCDLLVPSGPGYENITIANQVCAFAGSVSGSPTVSGDAYVGINYDYFWSHAWRNFGIIIAFLVGFATISALGVEILRPVAGGGDILLYKRGHNLKIQKEEEQIQMDSKTVRQVTRLQEGEPDVFSWQNINYTVPVNGGKRQLLKNVQGYVKPGTMTALMGESGAGKTTLLNVLSQRVNVGVITGDLFVNGSPTDASFKRSTGYVQQQDLHLAESTVRESLQFSARLRQPASVPDSEKLEWVEKVIDLLGMRSYAEAFVGKVGQGLNVEQRKKLSIGVELAAKPSLLLFLDEPTSGLDSQSAWGVVQLMKHLAAAGQSILCTIHQPSATLFEEFDRLLLLKKGGETVYFGDIGENSSTLINYFESHGSRKCDSSENPAEYILECIGAGATAMVDENWGEIWANSTECQEATREITLLQEELRGRPKRAVTPHMTARFAASHWTQFKYVLIRTYLQFWRSPSYIFSIFIMLVLGGLFVGFTFWNLKYTLSDLQGALFGIFLVIIVTQPLSNSIAVFAEQSRDLYEVREAASNTFHWAHLLLSQFFAEIPYNIFFSTLMFCCFYFPVKYDTSASVAGYFYLVYCVIFQFFHVSFSLAVLYFSPNAPAAAIIGSLLFSFMIAFCGVTQPVYNMPKFWTFMYKVSPHTYFVQSLLGVVMTDRKIMCSASEYNYFQPPSGLTCQEFAGPFVQNVGGYLQNPTATSNCAYCRYSIGAEYLATINVHESQKWRNVGFFFAYIIFNIVAMLGLYYLVRVKVWKAPKFNLFSKKKTEKKPEQA